MRKGSISICCRGVCHTAGRFGWRYAIEHENNGALTSTDSADTFIGRGAVMPGSGRIAAKSVQQLDVKTGEVVENYFSMHEAARLTGVTKK